MNAKVLDSIIRSEVKREMRRRRFLDEESKESEVEDEDEDEEVEDEDIDIDHDMSLDDMDDMDIDDMDIDEDVDVDIDDMSSYDDDLSITDEDDEETEDEDEKVATKDALSILLRREVNRQVKRKLKARDSWSRLSSDMQQGGQKKNVMDKRDADRCNAWKKTVGRER